MEKLDKIRAIIDYIENHLNQKVDLTIIAQAVHYSKYYLHRVFSETVGLTIHEYLQRRQLTEAAKLLVFSRKAILDIALLAGYESQQAFTAAFQSMYKQTPLKYREKEAFYPLQLKFEFGGTYAMLKYPQSQPWDIHFAIEEDMPSWMALVRLVIDGFPYLDEALYQQILRQRILHKQALILKDEETAIGVMLFSAENGSIDFLGIHPLYRKMGIVQAFLDKCMNELLEVQEISITTYRAGDKADTGQRAELLHLGFAEGELLQEFGYPTQRLILKKGGQQT